MALQVKLPGDSDRRVCNPERDLIWALPRIIEKAIGDIGTASTQKEFAWQLRAMLLKHGLVVDGKIAFFGERTGDANFMDGFEEFIKKFGAVWHYLRDDPKGEGLARLQELFKEPRFAPFRLLISLFVMRRLMAEVPYWICQVEASSKEPPRPEIERITEAVDELLSQL
ncbi:hypothetical protein LCGC14_0858400 [marine sediment metagenome]|uniref:Uncharacterized protein n=1 Tax=marine sediment metagenome TaxID=412755 RepID=A0A0F9SF67_9ZZZZ